MNTIDFIVVGLGALGSATLYHLAQQGRSVLGIDQFIPPHTFGSSHGDTRIIRQSMGEGKEYIPLVFRAYKLWQEVEKQIKKDLLVETGVLIIGSQKNIFLKQTINSATRFTISHELLTNNQLKNRFPQFKLVKSDIGYFESTGGFLRAEQCIEALLSLAIKNGALLRLNEKVLELDSQGTTLKVKTNVQEYTCRKVILTTGSWIKKLLAEDYRNFFTIYRQVLFWFDIQNSYQFYKSERFPAFIRELPNELEDAGIYGFPAINGRYGGIKIGREDYTTVTDPEKISRVVTPSEIHSMYQHYISPYLYGVEGKCIKAATCLYTITPDYGFIIDTDPKNSNIIIGCGGGHGFKHSIGIGEAVADLAIEESPRFDLTPFSIQRFNT